MSKKYRPRGDFILYREEARSVGKLVMPDRAAQGKRHVVVAIGPDVEDLNVGDIILVTGQYGVDVVPLPEEASLFLTRQANALVVVTEEE